MFVKAFNKKIPIKLVAYDDQSNTATAATLYNQLITQDKVDILVSDSGSVLTSVAVPIARDHKMLLIDQTGTGGHVLHQGQSLHRADVRSGLDHLAQIRRRLPHQGRARARHQAHRDPLFDQRFHRHPGERGARLHQGGTAPLEIVYDQGVPTNTTNYTVLINNIRATNPDAVIELGYPDNDIAFLRNLQDSGVKFKWLFASIPAWRPSCWRRTSAPRGSSTSSPTCPPR